MEVLSLKRIGFYLAALGLLLAGCTLELAYNKYAIVYGVADYEGTLNDLSYPDDDANAVEAMLLSQGYTVIRRIDAAATRSQLEADIAAVAALAGQEDLFVFYFSGHGGQSGSGPESSGSDGQDEWIFLRGSVDPLDLSATFNDDQLVQAFQPITSLRKVIILDTCNSGGFIGNELEADRIEPANGGPREPLGETLYRAIGLYANFREGGSDIPPEEALVIAATGEQDLSYEYGPPFGHGVFTYYLLQADRSADRNGDGLVTVTETYDFVYDRLSLEWNLLYGLALDAVFSPHVSGGPVDYVLFSVP